MNSIEPNKRFTAPLTVTQLAGDLWVTEREFSYYVDQNRTEVITVPDGTVTDFASVPRIVRGLIPKSGQHNQAAVLHDYLYKNLKEGWKDWPGKKYTRAECDKIFIDAMKVLGVSWIKRQTMYRAVRMFGGVHMKLTK